MAPIGGDNFKPARYKPIFANRFFTGLWTQRNPLREAAIPYLYERFYGGSRYDSLIDGSNVEITNKLTLARSPGTSVYNSSTFNQINSFYSFPTFTLTNQQIRVIADLATEVREVTGPSGNVLLYTKSQGAGQSYFQSVGNVLFFGDGLDQKKWIVNQGQTVNTAATTISTLSRAVVPTSGGQNLTNVETTVMTVSVTGTNSSTTAATAASTISGEFNLQGTLPLSVNGVPFAITTGTPNNLGNNAWTVPTTVYSDLSDGDLTNNLTTYQSTNNLSYLGDPVSLSSWSNITTTQVQVPGTSGTGPAATFVGIVTVVTSSAHHLIIGQPIVIAGTSDATFNGTYTVASIISSTSFTYNQADIGQLATATATGGTVTGLNNSGALSSGVLNWGTDAPTVAPANGPLAYAGAPTRYWAPSTSIQVGYSVLDTNGNIQLLTGNQNTSQSFTTGASTSVSSNGSFPSNYPITPTGGVTILPFNNATSAFDGDPNTSANQVVQHSRKYAVCTWGFSYSGSSPVSLKLNVLSQVSAPILSGTGSAAVYYSLDNATTWQTLWSDANPVARAKQWDSVSITPATVVSNILVSAFMESHDDAGLQIYEINLQVGTNTVPTVLTGSRTTGTQTPKWNSSLYGLTSDGTAIWQNCGAISQWQANFVYSLNSPTATILDTNGNLQVVQATGVSGATQPTWATAAGQTTTDGTITWFNAGPGAVAAFSGWTWAYAYHCTDGHVSTCSPLSQPSGPVLGTLSIPISGVGSTDIQVDEVWIFRTLDGGSTLFFDGSVPNPALNTAWQFTDTTIDADLNEFIPGPINHANDPPPVGSVIPAYHVGRIFVAVNNVVYYSGGPDTITGDGNQSFPPLNNFVFPFQVRRFIPLAVGLLVFTSGGIYSIVGQGTAGSPLYAVPFVPGIGLSSYNELSLNGSIVFFRTTEGQVLSFDPSSGFGQDGFPIGDLLSFATPAGNYTITLAQTNVTNAGRNPNFLYTDTYKLTVTGAPPNSPLDIFVNGGWTIGFGKTDSNGAWSYQSDRSNELSYLLQFPFQFIAVRVNGILSNTLNFTVAQTTPSSLSNLVNTIVNTTSSGRNPNFLYTDSYTVTLTGATANTAVDINVNGGWTSNFATTNSSGGFSYSNSWSATETQQYASSFPAQYYYLRSSGQLSNAIVYAFTTVTPNKAGYLTWHVAGSEDSALYVSDGSTGWYRMNRVMSPETGLCWSPFRTITGGCSAVQSVETAPGVHQLLIGPPRNSTGPILTRDLTTYSDNGNTYSAYATIGNIVLAEPGQTAAIDFITIDSQAVGTRPMPSFLVDEIRTSNTAPFQSMTAYVADPPQQAESNTLYSNRYYFAQTQSTVWCRHLQLKFFWTAENAANEILAYGLYGKMQTEL